MQSTMVEALNQALALELERDERVVLLGQDIGPNGGVFRVTDQLQKQFGEKRVFDTPLSESAIIGSSVGMAVYGLRPVAEIQFAGFLFLSMSQIVTQASRIRFRSAGAYSCPLVIRSPFGGGVRTPNSTPTAWRASSCKRQASRWCCPLIPTTPRACWQLPSTTRTRCCFWSI